MTTTAAAAPATRREARRAERYAKLYDAVAIFIIRAIPAVVLVLCSLGIIK